VKFAAAVMPESGASAGSPTKMAARDRWASDFRMPSAECVGRPKRGERKQHGGLDFVDVRAVLFAQILVDGAGRDTGHPRSQCRSERSIHRWSRGQRRHDFLDRVQEQ